MALSIEADVPPMLYRNTERIALAIRRHAVTGDPAQPV
jgi:hypothetical protein